MSANFPIRQIINVWQIFEPEPQADLQFFNQSSFFSSFNFEGKGISAGLGMGGRCLQESTVGSAMKSFWPIT